MKKTMQYLAMLLCTAFALLSCQGKVEQAPENVPLSVSVDTIRVNASESSVDIVVKCVKKPYIVGNYDWCSAKSSAFASNTVTVTITISENTKTEVRIADFSIICNDEKAKLYVFQEAGQGSGEIIIDPANPLAYLDAPELPKNIATQMASKLGLGWNLGNQMDAYNNDKSSETAWGQPKCTQQTFDKLKSYGFKSVRIPITWMGHIGEAPEYKIEDAWMDRVAEIVGYCEKAGLNCIINTHHDERHNNNGAYNTYHWQDIYNASISEDVNKQIKEELAALWGQIADKFKDKGDFLIFEPFNEINDGGWGYSASFMANPSRQTGVLNEWNQVFVDAVRAKGGKNANRWLCVVGYAASSTFTIPYLKLPTDSAENRLMVGVHCYDPYKYCTEATYSEWGHTGSASKKPSEDEKNLIELMMKLYKEYTSNDIPCYFGEFGCVNRSEVRAQAFQKYYLEFFCRASRDYGMPCFLWDNGNNGDGERFGYVNHGTGAYMAQGADLIPVMVKAVTSNESGYNLKTIYENSPR